MYKYTYIYIEREREREREIESKWVREVCGNCGPMW